MAKLKRGKWSPQETNLVKGIPKDTNTFSVLTKLAAKLNRSYATVYQKWLAESKKADTSSTSVPAMSFKIVEVTGRQKVSEKEQAAMIKGIEAARTVLIPQSKRGILIPTRLVHRAKEYLTAKNPTHEYSYSKSAIKGHTILSRKL